MNWQDIHRLDQDVTLWINGFHSEISDVVWTFFSNIPVWIPLYVLIIAFVIRRLGWRKGGIVVASAVLTVTCCSLFSHYIKELTERLRPLLDAYMLENSLHVLETGGKYTFFSLITIFPIILKIKISTTIKLNGIVCINIPNRSIMKC